MHLGIDLGGTNLKAGIIDAEGSLLFSSSQETYAEKGVTAVLESISDLIAQIINIHTGCTSLGFGVPGLVNKGIVKFAPNLPGWLDVDLYNYFSERFSLPIAIDNDANAAALSELELGTGRGLDNFLYITLGTGIGGAIISEKKIFRGESGGAGEIGHTIIDYNSEHDGSIPAFRKGTLEEFVGRKQIISLAKKLAQNYHGSILNQIEELDVNDISAAIYKNDPAAVECFRTIGEILGIGLASAITLLDIKIIIVGGGISNSHPFLFETALETIKNRTMPSIAKNARILKAHFTKDAGIIGAALLGKIYGNSI